MREKQRSAAFMTKCPSLIPHQIQSQVTPHAIVVLPRTDGMEMLLCYEDEGVYVNTYGRITKDVALQWGEMPTSVGTSDNSLLTSKTKRSMFYFYLLHTDGLITCTFMYVHINILNTLLLYVCFELKIYLNLQVK